MAARGVTVGFVSVLLATLVATGAGGVATAGFAARTGDGGQAAAVGPVQQSFDLNSLRRNGCRIGDGVVQMHED